MNSGIGIERCLSFINTQLKNGKVRNRNEDSGEIRAVTISRQTGCGALAIAEKLANYLQARTPEDKPHWTVFDRNLVERVLVEHSLPQRLARFMPENWSSEIEDTLDELFGLHPPSWLLVRETAETILRLVKIGNVIIIGRGANLITSKFDSVFHVRLVAPLQQRAQHIQETEDLDRRAALELIHREDKGRKRYLRKHYEQDINDPLLYHVLLNTGLLDYDRTARLIGGIVLEKQR
jgi:cytidylate kinase